MILSLLSFAAAVICYTIGQLQQHRKLKWMSKHTSFWGQNSWMRKYNYTADMYKDLPPNNWYYKTFDIDYKERFPLSATLLVFLTDGYHLMQFGFKIFLALAFVPFVCWWALAYWVLFGVVFTICYKLFSR